MGYMAVKENVIARIRGLCYKYPISEEYVLKNINLDVRREEVSGCCRSIWQGKSTLLYSLNGIIPHALVGK